MRKCYVLIGTWDQDGNKYIAGVFTSYKKALKFAEMFPDMRTYNIKTEIVL